MRHAVQPISPLSAKRELLCSDGYLLSSNTQAQYHFNWHRHDCAMLMWMSTGTLQSQWSGEDAVAPASSLTLLPGMAILLPASTAHASRTRTHRQRHGQIYIDPDLLRSTSARGAFYLDEPSRSMLATLGMPGLSSRSTSTLVQALLMQLEHGKPVLHAKEEMADVAHVFRARLQQSLQLQGLAPRIEDIAQEMGVSMRSLQRHCLQTFGCSPVQMRRQLLAHTARHLLAQGTRLADVSVQLGFASSGHLTRLMRGV